MNLTAILTMYNIYRTSPAKWSGMAEPSTADITTTQCNAYEALTTFGKEYEMVEDHEYDVIPALKGELQMEGQQDYAYQIPKPTYMSTLQETCWKADEA